MVRPLSKSPLTLLLSGLAMLAFAGNSVLARLALGSDSIDAASFSSLRFTGHGGSSVAPGKTVAPFTDLRQHCAWGAWGHYDRLVIPEESRRSSGNAIPGALVLSKPLVYSACIARSKNSP